MTPNRKKTLTTKVLRRIDQVHRDEWEKIYPKTPEGYNLYKSMDESNFSQFSFYYILVYDKRELVGATPMFYMDFPLETTVQGRLKSVILFFRKFFPGIFKLKVLICGYPMGQCRIGIKGDAALIIKAILKRVSSIAKKKKVSVIAFKDLDQSYEHISKTLTDAGFYKFYSLPNTELHIDFDSFDKYLSSLSRVSRDGLKRKFKKADSMAKIEFETSGKLNESELDDVYGLYLQTTAKAETQFETVPKEFFANVSKNMGHQAKYYLWRINKKIVAFALCFINSERFIDFYLGFDYAISYEYNLYYVRVRDLIKWCIENKIPVYEMGYTGYEPKRRMGFAMVPLFAYAKHRNPVINILFKVMCEFLKPENFHKEVREVKNKKAI